MKNYSAKIFLASLGTLMLFSDETYKSTHKTTQNVDKLIKTIQKQDCLLQKKLASQAKTYKASVKTRQMFKPRSSKYYFKQAHAIIIFCAKGSVHKNQIIKTLSKGKDLNFFAKQKMFFNMLPGLEIGSFIGTNKALLRTIIV